MTGDLLVPPVRLVKTIGDAVMLVSPEAEPLVATSLGLLEASDAEGEALPPAARRRRQRPRARRAPATGTGGP